MTQPTTCSSEDEAAHRAPSRPTRAGRARSVAPAGASSTSACSAGVRAGWTGMGPRLLRSLGTCDLEAAGSPVGPDAGSAAEEPSLGSTRTRASLARNPESRSWSRRCPRTPPSGSRPATPPSPRPARRHGHAAHLDDSTRPARGPLRLSRRDDSRLHDAGLRLPRLPRLAERSGHHRARALAGQAREAREVPRARRADLPAALRPGPQPAHGARRLRREEALRQDGRRRDPLHVRSTSTRRARPSSSARCTP